MKGRIARLEQGIPPQQARLVVDASGKIVTPGLIDLHTHVFPDVGPYGIEPDPYCVMRGVTTVIDAGTSGAYSFPAFRKYTIPHAAARARPTPIAIHDNGHVPGQRAGHGAWGIAAQT